MSASSVVVTISLTGREHFFGVYAGVGGQVKSMDPGLGFEGWQSGGHGAALGTGRGSFRRLQMHHAFFTGRF
jgi:hypothetical protein